MSGKVFSFTLEKDRGAARAGVITTAHGLIQTPIFMPVGTQASVKSLDSRDLDSVGAQIVLGNTYHLFLQPGTDQLESAGGLHQFMQWQGPLLTDSGGYQVFSLGAQQKTKGGRSTIKLSEEGVVFTSHRDGSRHQITPERSIQIQQSIGADIIMAFDECAPDQVGRQEMADSVARTLRWAERSKIAWEETQRKSVYGQYQALFGIVQGGVFSDLRQQSLKGLREIEFDGYALGGETVGYNLEGTKGIMAELGNHFPQNAPRYAMGMGRDPQDIVEAVLLGFDMFDCVGPTRLARNGALFEGSLMLTSNQPYFQSNFAKGRLHIGNQEFTNDQDPISSSCDCYTCTQGYSRAYLHHLYKSKELSFYRLASIHNLRVMIRIAQDLRRWILEN